MIVKSVGNSAARNEVRDALRWALSREQCSVEPYLQLSHWYEGEDLREIFRCVERNAGKVSFND